MNDFLKMDIFFISTTAAVVVVGFMAAVAFYYVIRILRHVEHIADEASKETDNLRVDIMHVRAAIKQGKFGWRALKALFMRKGSRKPHTDEVG